MKPPSAIALGLMLVVVIGMIIYLRGGL